MIETIPITYHTRSTCQASRSYEFARHFLHALQVLVIKDLRDKLSRAKKENRSSKKTIKDLRSQLDRLKKRVVFLENAAAAVALKIAAAAAAPAAAAAAAVVVAAGGEEVVACEPPVVDTRSTAATPPAATPPETQLYSVKSLWGGLKNKSTLDKIRAMGKTDAKEETDTDGVGGETALVPENDEAAERSHSTRERGGSVQKMKCEASSQTEEPPETEITKECAVCVAAEVEMKKKEEEKRNKKKKTTVVVEDPALGFQSLFNAIPGLSAPTGPKQSRTDRMRSHLNTGKDGFTAANKAAAKAEAEAEAEAASDAAWAEAAATATAEAKQSRAEIEEELEERVAKLRIEMREQLSVELAQEMESAVEAQVQHRVEATMGPAVEAAVKVRVDGNMTKLEQENKALLEALREEQSKAAAHVLPSVGSLTTMPAVIEAVIRVQSSQNTIEEATGKKAGGGLEDVVATRRANADCAKEDGGSDEEEEEGADEEAAKDMLVEHLELELEDNKKKMDQSSLLLQEKDLLLQELTQLVRSYKHRLEGNAGKMKRARLQQGRERAAEKARLRSDGPAPVRAAAAGGVAIDGGPASLLSLAPVNPRKLARNSPLRPSTSAAEYRPTTLVRTVLKVSFRVCACTVRGSCYVGLRRCSSAH